MTQRMEDKVVFRINVPFDLLRRFRKLPFDLQDMILEDLETAFKRRIEAMEVKRNGEREK